MRTNLGNYLKQSLCVCVFLTNFGCSRILSPSGGNTLSGVVQLGRVSGATISVYEMLSDGSKGSLQASTTTDSNGEYTVSLGTYSGSVIIESVGGTYIDEATGSTKTASSLSALSDASAASNAPITPMSHLVKERTIALLATNTLSEAKTQAVSEVAGLFGVSAEDLSVTPTSATALSSLNTRATRAALGLAAFSYLLKDFRHSGSAVSVEGALEALAEDLKDDGKINGSVTSTVAKKLAMEWKASMAAAKTAAAANSNLVFSKLSSEILAEVSSTTLDTGSELEGLQEDGSFYINGVNTGLTNGTGLFLDQNFYNNGTVIGSYDGTTVTMTSDFSGSYTGTENFNFYNGYSVLGGASLTTTGDVWFEHNGYSHNWGTITSSGTVIFQHASTNYGSVYGNAEFWDNGFCANQGTVFGNATFITSSGMSSGNCNAGTVTGNATFNDRSYNFGTVNGIVTYNGFTGNNEHGYFILGQLTTLDSSGNGEWNDHFYSSGALFTGLGDGTLGEQNKYYSSGSLLTGTAANGACYINGEERLYPDSFIFGDYGSTPVTDTNLNTLSNYWRSDTWLPATCFPDSNDTVTITAPITSGTLTTQTINLQSSFSGGTLNASVTIGKGGEVAGVMTGGTINGNVTFGVTGWASASYPILEGGTINGNVTFESGSIMVGGIITGNITWNGFTGQYSKPGASYDGKYFAGGHLRQPEDGPLNGSYYINGEVVGACSGDCYLEGSSPNYAQGLSIGSLRSGPDNTTLTLQYANGTDGFKVWREKDGNRILNATGLIANGWQKMLVRAGTAFSASEFTAGSNIAGRVCPTHVFLNHTNMTATNRCVYYDEGNTAQTLDAESSTGQEGLDWLTEWNRSETGQESASSYYEGNIKTCADKGMRLPTVYETTAEPFEDFLPSGDGISPTWAGGTNGVPGVSSSQTWTASASADAPFVYYSWSGSGSGSAYSYAPDPEAEEQGVDDSLSVRCVLPSH